MTKNQTNVGIISNGALVEREVNTISTGIENLRSTCSIPITTATKLASTLISVMPRVEAQAIDSGTIAVKLDASYDGNLSQMIAAAVENVDVRWIRLRSSS